MYKKSVMRVQSCCFAYKTYNYIFFDVLVAVRVLWIFLKSLLAASDADPLFKGFVTLQLQHLRERLMCSLVTQYFPLLISDPKCKRSRDEIKLTPGWMNRGFQGQPLPASNKGQA